jgi:penicillin-binding protein 2
MEEQYCKNYVGMLVEDDFEAYAANQVEQTWMAAVYSIDDAYFNIYNQSNVYDASIGQGTNQFTPLQLANYMATLVNGGNRYSVHLVDKILDQDGKVVKEYKPELIEKIAMKDVNVSAVKDGMKDVTSGDGTARAAFEGFPISNGGKQVLLHLLKFKRIWKNIYGFYVGFGTF